MRKPNIKIATIGAATQDVFLLGSALKAKRDVRTHEFVEQFPLGAKLTVDKVVFSTGGGATNAAVTFARHGFDTCYLGKIGDDPAGQHVIKDLEAYKVKTKFIKCDLKGTTGYSTILLAPRGGRTVLVYRGVSGQLQAEDFNYFSQLKVDWLYMSSLSGNFPLLEAIIHYAKTHGIKLVINPGAGELEQADRFRKLLHNFSVVSVNKEEAQQLYTGRTARELATQLAEECAVAVVTDGPKGSYASDGAHVYRAGLYEDVSVTDRTGAGDAFTSGFTAKIIQGGSIEEALVFGSANSTAVVTKVGAKAAILPFNASIKSMKISKTPVRKEVTHA